MLPLGAMAPKTQQAWKLAHGQHGVVTRQQLIGLGFTTDAIRHRLTAGRLHRVHRGVYSVGRPELGREGIWMAAVLSCGSGAALSHASAAALWGIAREEGIVEVSAPISTRPRAGIVVHRRADLELISRLGIPLTPPVSTLVD